MIVKSRFNYKQVILNLTYTSEILVEYLDIALYYFERQKLTVVGFDEEAKKQVGIPNNQNQKLKLLERKLCVSFNSECVFSYGNGQKRIWS